MKNLVAVTTLGALCIVAASPTTASAQATDPVSVFVAFVKVFNNDPDAVQALVTDDAVVRIIPPPPGTSGVWTGQQEIRQLVKFSRTQNVTQEIVGNPRVDGNRVSATVMVHTNDFRNWGIGPVEHTYEAVVDGGKIRSFDAIMAPSERDRVAAAANAYFATHPPAGMPTTGDGQSSVLALLLLCLGIVAVTIGLNLRKRVATRASE